MNYSQVIKKEILSKHIKDEHCKRAFLAGLIRGSGVLFEQDGLIGIDFKVGSKQAEIIVLDCLNTCYGLQEEFIESKSLGKKDKFTISIFGQLAIKILTDLEVFKKYKGEYTVNFNMYGGTVTSKECCLRAFFRGLFIGCGSCTVPSKDNDGSTGYHLQLAFSHPEPAQATLEQLLKFNIDCKITRRKEHFIAYIKSAEAIKDFIAFLPCPVTVLNITDLMINREISNNSNRQKNCDIANLNRQVEAVAKQLEAIKKIEEKGLLKNLKQDLQDTARARLNNPTDTLIELSEKLGISKSCLNHRLRKLVEISNKQ